MAVLASENGTWPNPLRRLIGLPVRIVGVDVGRTADVILDRSLGHVLGFVVDVRGAHRHFLPWVAALVEHDHVATRSILSLLSSSELAFYLDNCARLIDPVGGVLHDVAVDRDGVVVPPVVGAPRAPSRPVPVRGMS